MDDTWKSEVIIGCYFFPLNSCPYEMGNYRGLIIVAHPTIIKLVMCVCVCVCLSVCEWVCIRFISNISWPILMKHGRMMYNDNISIPFEDELNRFISTEVTENPFFTFSYYVPLVIFIWCYFPFFIIGELNCNSFLKTPDTWKWGGPGMCSSEHTKF